MKLMFFNDYRLGAALRSAARKPCTRAALTPKSLRPTRDTERTSTRLPLSAPAPEVTRDGSGEQDSSA